MKRLQGVWSRRTQGRFPANERGSLLVGVLALLVMLSAFLLMAAHGVAADADSATKARWRCQAFYAAESGLQYGLKQANADSSWAGLNAPGKNTMDGSFTVAVSRLDNGGNNLPANEKRLISTGMCNSAQSVVTMVVQFN
jgi:Tfp pilus assembly protein PilX